MKTVRWVMTLLPMLLGHAAAGVAPTLRAGSWVQLLSDQFVQATTEMDWHCVRAVIIPVRETNATTVYHLIKAARLHSPDGPLVKTPAVEISLEEDGQRLRMYHSLLLSGEPYQHFMVRNRTSDLLVLTGENEPSLYVYVRDVHEFEEDDSKGRRLFDDLAAWGYVASYKEPRRSFHPLDCANTTLP